MNLTEEQIKRLAGVVAGKMVLDSANLMEVGWNSSVSTEIYDCNGEQPSPTVFCDIDTTEGSLFINFEPGLAGAKRSFVAIGFEGGELSIGVYHDDDCQALIYPQRHKLTVPQRNETQDQITNE